MDPPVFRPLPSMLSLLFCATPALSVEPDREPLPPMADTMSDLVRVWDCRFDDTEKDVNYDAWPDRWTRVYDDEHPSYAQMQIEPGEPAALVIRPDGASATAISPPIHVMPKFSYKMRMRTRLSGSEHGEARIRLAFYTRDEPRQIKQSLPIASDGQWHDLELGDYQPEDADVDRVYIQVDYQRGDRGDLHAELSIADVELFRLPSIKIDTGSLYNVYTDINDVKVTCSLSGILKRNPEVRFQLLDATNREIGKGDKKTLDGKVISESRTLASEIVDGFDDDNKESYEGEKDWKPPIKDYGFYRVRVGMFNKDTQLPIGESRSITIAVVREGLESSEQGEFGWSLPEGDSPLSFEVLQKLLPRVGVRMVKMPVWFKPGDEQRGDEILRFAEQLSARGIDTIGVLEDPTASLTDPLYDGPPPPIEGLLSADPSHWTPLIDHVITRLSLRIRWWQLGRDGDTSFVGYEKLIDELSAIRNQMFRFGQDIRMGIGWRWDHAQQRNRPHGWDFEQMAGREQLNAAGLSKALTEAPPTDIQRWVLVEPPEVVQTVPEGADADDPDDPLIRRAQVQRHQQRVRDFVEQILVAKMNGADGIFVADPFSGSADPAEGLTGVMNRDGTPGELLLPWRTCARLLGGAKYLGSIQLPNQSDNWLFRRQDGSVVMVLWNLKAPIEDANATPIEEVLYLGEDIQSIDVWGGFTTPEKRGHRQVIRVGRMPRFVMGLNESIASWRMATRFEKLALPSVFGIAHPNAVTFQNTFAQGAGGRMEIVVPDHDDPLGALTERTTPGWDIWIDEPRLSLRAGERKRVPVQLVLKGADYGDQLVRIDFLVNGDREYRFSVWRELRVGLDDIELDVETFVDNQGRLIVEQRMSQKSGDPSDFKCLLYIQDSDKRRKRAQVFQLGSEVDKKQYIYRNSEGLVGLNMRLQIEEVDGGRVLIHRFKIDPKRVEKAKPPEGGTATDKKTWVPAA